MFTFLYILGEQMGHSGRLIFYIWTTYCLLDNWWACVIKVDMNWLKLVTLFLEIHQN